MAVGTQMQQRRATAAEWTTSNYVLADGEIGFVKDTGTFKIGNGVTPWTDLDYGFDGVYLPILGKAADSELLNGISADFFIREADTSVLPTNDSFVQRTADGGIKATDATEASEVTTLSQQTAAIVASQQEQIVRTVTANTTVALTDIGKMIFVNNASLTAQITVTIPLNATVAFPIGSWIDICASGVGGAKMIPFNGTVGLYGRVNAMPPIGVIRMLKIGTDQWMGSELKQGRLPTYKVRRTSAGDNYGSSYVFVPWDTVDTSDTYNPDNEWFSVPGSGMATARRVIVNKEGEYQFNVAMATNGTGGLTYCRLCRMVNDNTLTGGRILVVNSMTAVTSISWRQRVLAGESFGVMHGFAAGNLGKADAEATGGDPHNFKITRIGD